MFKIINYIRETNGDVLGVILFILLIVYFIMLDNKNIYEYLLLGCCSIALIVDTVISFKTIKK